jgi:hypothetical protein
MARSSKNWKARMYHLGLAVHKPGGENGEVRIAYKTLEQLDDSARRLRWD